MADSLARGILLGWRRWWLPLSGAVVLALAFWARSPAVPKLAAGPMPGDTGVVHSAAVADLRAEIARVADRLRALGSDALTVPPDPARAFGALPWPRAGDYEWGIVVYEDTIPLAWSGRVRVATDTLSAPISAAVTPFYAMLTAVARSGNRRAVATAIINAEPPADVFSRSVAARVAQRHPVSGFTVSSLPARGVTVYGDSANPMLVAQPLLLSPGELRLGAVQRWRGRIALLTAMALVAFLAFAWRFGATAERVGAAGVAFAAFAIVPLNAFSARSRLFDPAYYFTPAGGPWTANAGVLLFTTIVLAVLVIARVRGRPRVRHPVPATGVGVALALAGFVVVRELAAGIGQPARGVNAGIWLAWQVPLFLAALSAVLPLAWIVDTGIRRRRRLTRRSFFVATTAAAVLAASLVWLTTVGQRIRLAERDIAALHEADDDYLEALLFRVSDGLAAVPPPRDRVALLRASAQSELAIAGYPFALAAWDADGFFRAGVDLSHGVDDTTLAAPFVRDALIRRQTRVGTTRGPLGAVWVAAVPHSEGGVTTVTALPRSRLVETSPYAPFLGLRGADTEEPPYSVSLAEGLAPNAMLPVPWWRVGNELHADAPLLTSAGLARVHLEIDLRSPEALGQRLVLVVLLNFAIAGFLVLLVRAAEPVFARRIQGRVRHWTGSYRSRLTLALFAFFVIPAGAFAVWGYRRMEADNRRSRELVVRETLHAASAARAEQPLPDVAQRLGTPLLAYDDGLLAATSDPLLEALAPVGRTLPPGVHLRLNVADELTAYWEERVGEARVLLGYRSVSGDGRRAVLAAPARGTELILARRARDLTVLLLFATAVGGLAALWLSGVAAHQFGRPIAALRRAARSVARGDRRPPELPRAPSEFEPVFTAFRRMSADLERSRVEMARAERVLAWGEMARQVAHEIKNPLTPMRLGMQYLQRARHDPRVDFDKVFEENSRRILEEIERLDDIARAFSRYGSAPAELPPPEPVDVAAVLRDLVAFERMGAGGVDWALDGADQPCHALARPAELREVLMNVFENARAAGSGRIAISVGCDEQRVSVTVRDDGSGIPADILPRIFEPHFSTRTTGSGLGLAISRRLLDAWGGSIAIESATGAGTLVTIELERAISG
jgi:two-component system nitrogen regulation sensor histidine kinase NtrY